MSLQKEFLHVNKKRLAHSYYKIIHAKETWLYTIQIYINNIRKQEMVTHKGSDIIMSWCKAAAL